MVHHMAGTIMTTKAKRAPRIGTRIVWPKGLEERYGISAPTRWRAPEKSVWRH